MAKKQSAELECKKFLPDLILVSMIAVLLVSLALFILYPLLMLLVDSFYLEGKITLEVFGRVLSLERFQEALRNTLVLGMIIGIASIAIGLLFAYVEVYVKLKAKVFKELFAMVSMLPVVSPSFVLPLSVIMLSERSDITTRSLLGIYDSNVYGFKGIAVAQTLTFFFVRCPMFRELLENIDPSSGGTIRDVGATWWKVFTSVTFPLLLSGLGSAFLITLTEPVADLANPVLIGDSYDTPATTIYLQVTGAHNSTGAAAIFVVLPSLTVVLFLIQKYYLEKKTVATLVGKASRMRVLTEDKSVTVPLTTLCGIMSAFVTLMCIMVPSGALLILWDRGYSLSPKWFQYMPKTSGLKAFKDSFVLSLIAAPLTAFLSMAISHLVAKKRSKARGFTEFVSMLAVAVPGTMLGIECTKGYTNGLLRTDVMSDLYGTGFILTIIFIVRGPPTGTRSGISTLRQIDKSIKESTYDMGANSTKVLMTVTLPLIKGSSFNGLVTTFVWSITAISVIILLVTPDLLLIICQINGQVEKGDYGMVCAYATILIVVAYGAVLIIGTLMKLLGVSRKIKQE